MKKFILALTLLGAVTFANATPLDVAVKGMTCGGCEQTIEGKFSKQPEVLSAKADYKTGQLHLELKEGKSLSPKQISTLLTEVGYEVKDK